MRILIDARVIQDHFPGIGRYAYNLLDALAPLLPGELLALTAQNARNTRYDLARLARHPNLHLIPTDIPIFHPRSQTALPGLIRDLHPDLVHFLYNVRPWRVAPPSLLTLYDIIPRRFPQYYPWLTRLKIEIIQRLAIHTSHHFLAISHSTAADFAEHDGIPRDRITITPLAPDPVFQPQPPEILTAFRQRRNLPENYLLYLGSNKPHKNLPRLIQAWRAALDMGLSEDAHLVIAGHWDARYPQAKQLAASLGISDRVQFLGPVSGEELPLLYAAARAFIFPSQYEGFGLPALEAMACGTPVGASRAPGLSEAVGDAALTFDPLSISEMTQVIHRLMTDTAEREKRRQAGLARAAAFTWQHTAELTLDAYRRV
ncbi:MAG TPA: glycosyltransferase family 1 protein [Anaerolineae bacterium]|nr:glycosyltransferase family 1 protein [Anaerolineae bacterium]